MIRSSAKFVSYKDLKAVIADLKKIYTAVNEEQASAALLDFADKWDAKYPMIAESWSRHWQEITPFLQYPEFIKKAIYTTNIIEASHTPRHGS
jgi:transposase-like protein